MSLTINSKKGDSDLKKKKKKFKLVGYHIIVIIKGQKIEHAWRITVYD